MSVLRNPHPPVHTIDLKTFDYSKYNFPDVKVHLDDDGLLTLFLDRPQKQNAFTNGMCHSIVFVFELADADDRVKVVIITGSGNKAFCAGADLSSDGFGTDSSIPISDHRDGGGQASGAILRCRKLVIAAVNGNAIGVGITMILPADIRIASETAKLALPFVKRGITLEGMSGYVLPRLVGHANALEICMTGDTYLPTAKPFSPMFSSILPQEQVLPAATSLGRRLCKQNSSVSMALNKALIWRHPTSPEATHLLDSKCIALTSQSNDAKEGVESFLQKRAPNFTGNLGALDHSGFYPWWDQVDITGKKVRGPKPASSKL